MLVGQSLARRMPAHYCLSVSAYPAEKDGKRRTLAEVYASRAVAQLGSAPVWGTGGRRFKSCLPDHTRPHSVTVCGFYFSGKPSEVFFAERPAVRIGKDVRAEPKIR